MLHCKVEKELDGTITASSPEVTLIILPDGPSKAFNRNFQRKVMNGGKLHAKLNNIAARIQQEKITETAAWEELEELIKKSNTPESERMLVGELDGVRVYIQDSSIIMTKRDLYK